MKMQWIKTIMATGILMAATLPQAHAQQASGSIHGNVQNAAGLPMTSGNVKLTTEAIPSDTTKYKYDISIDQNGDFKSSGIEPGTYSAVFFQNGKTVDLLQNLKIVANQDLAANFDMTRAAFINGMTPEEKKALEEYKTKIASTVGENSKIANLNALLQQARDAIKAKDFDTAASLMQQAISARPAEAILWFTLGDAQAGQKKYDDAGTSYTKAIALNDANKKPMRATQPTQPLPMRLQQRHSPLKRPCTTTMRQPPSSTKVIWIPL
jgi:TolA-binding protein